MNRQNVKKRQYAKPCIEVIGMEAEGSLLTASATATIGGHTSGGSVVGSGRGGARQPSIIGHKAGTTVSKR